MKIALLHVSDFHINRDDFIENKKIEKLVDSLGVVAPFDNAIIIFSGDLTFHGAPDEFVKANRVLNGIVMGIKNRYSTPYVPLLCIPGNHDMKLSEDSRKHSDIREYYDQGTIEQHLMDEYAAMDGYFSYSLPTNKFRDNKLYCIYRQHYESFNIQFNLINTAPFSTLLPDDKECHYFSKEQMHHFTKRDDATICITVMHHGIEWFDWSCKSQLEKTIFDNSEFLLTGHDHISSGKTVSIDNDSGVWVSAAGSMDFSRYTNMDSYNLIVIDTNSKLFSGYCFKWDPTSQIYIHKVQIADAEINTKIHRLQPRSSFIKELKEDSRHSISDEFLNYFVFPRLICQSRNHYNRDIVIQNFDDLSEFMHRNPKIVIEGESNSGKSTLLRYLYIRMSERSIPILRNAEKEKCTAKNIVKTLFTSQYGTEQSIYERFAQSSIDDRYIFIDNWESIDDKNANKILSYLGTVFRHIILASRLDYSNTDVDVKDSVREELISVNDTNTLRIEPFFRIKRTELVKRVCITTGINDDKVIENVTNAINTLVENHASMFILNSEFIIQYTKYFSRDEMHSYQRGEQVFSDIFDANTKSTIANNTAAQNVPEYITVLEELSYYMYANLSENLSIVQIEEIIGQYNRQYDANVGTRKFIDAMLRAKILSYVGENYDITFTNRNILSYFIARYIHRDMSENGNFDVINECAKNICYGINGDILLFITYLTKNTRIIKEISTLASTLMNDWKPLCIGKDGLSLLSQVPIEMVNKIKEPTKEDNEKKEAYMDAKEAESHESINLSTHGAFDRDLDKYDTLTFKLRRAFAYTDLISKALPAFSSILKAELKSTLVDQIYSYPNRIARNIILPIDEHLDSVTEDLLLMAKQMFDEHLIKKEPTKDQIAQILHNWAMGVTLSIMDHYAACAVDEKTYKILEKYVPKSQDDIVQRLLILENAGDTGTLYDYSVQLLKENNDACVQAMIRCIVRKHLMEHQAIPYNKRTQIIDTIFGKHARIDIKFLPMNNK